MYYRIFYASEKKDYGKRELLFKKLIIWNSLGGLVGLVRKILIGTVVVEGIGAVFTPYNLFGTMGLQKESGMEFFIQFLHFATQELTSLEMTVWQDTQQIL